MTVETPELIEFLNQQYPPGPYRFEAALSTQGNRQAYKLASPAGRFVAKVTAPERSEALVRADTATLDHLAQSGFPAAGPRRSRDGRLYIPFEGRFLYLYAYCEGRPPEVNEELYARLGRLLAWLHSLPAGPASESEYRPESALAGVRLELERLLSQPGPVSGEERAAAQDCLERIHRFPDFTALPRGIIHTDPYLSNLLDGPDGAGGGLFLIDWDDAGVSYPLLDVGYVLAHLTTFTARDRRIWHIPGPEHGSLRRADWGRIFLTSYEAVRPLTNLERERLPAAVEFAFLVYIQDWETGRLLIDQYQRMLCMERDD